MNDKSEKRLLQLVEDYLSGNFTMASEKPLIDEIIKLTSPTLSTNDVFEVLFEGDVQTPETVAGKPERCRMTRTLAHQRETR